MRQTIAGEGFSTPEFEWGLALNLAYFVPAALFFRWMFESVRWLACW
ncbi:MAG TPA: hypothetical protein VEI01_22415 [Terriglobales bacterium]|nr:hypothetical protein [Terriglobales bacterium]